MSMGPRTEPDPDDDYLHFDLDIRIPSFPFEPLPNAHDDLGRSHHPARGGGPFMHQPTIETDVIGGFPVIDPNCAGCGRPLRLENAWMSDGCSCNSPLGINSMNETRWRLLMQCQQQQAFEIARLRNLVQVQDGSVLPGRVILELPL